VVAILLIVIGIPESRSQPLPRAAAFLARLAFALPRLEPRVSWHFGSWNDRDPRAQVRQRLWWWAHRRAYDGPVTTEWYLGLKFNHHLSGDVSFCTYVDGRYEPNEMYAVASLLRSGMTFVDVGANQGIFTLLAAAAVGPSGAVHAFEPSPRDRARLVSNIELNRLTNVHVHSAALGSDDRTASLIVSDQEHPGHNTLGGLSYRETSQAYSVVVAVQTLDQVVERERLRRVDLMKIDVEGSETAVLKGATRTLQKFRPVIIAEAQQTSLRQMGSSVRELMDLIRSHGYEIQAFGGTGEPTPLISDEIESVNMICKPEGLDR
jgi:FkbM family methyltransferase